MELYVVAVIRKRSHFSVLAIVADADYWHTRFLYKIYQFFIPSSVAARHAIYFIHDNKWFLIRYLFFLLGCHSISLTFLFILVFLILFSRLKEPVQNLIGNQTA